MNAHALSRIATEFQPRIEECPDCFEGCTEELAPDGYVRVPCDSCCGTSEVDKACDYCLIITALNEDGECERCHDGNVLTREQFNEKWHLTTVSGDPLRDAA